MTVDELHDVIKREFDGVNYRLDRINGRVSEHDREITGLKIRDAYWAGAVAAIASFVAWLFGR